MIGFKPSCTLVVCTRKRPKQLEVCLEAVTRLNYPDLEILVIENDPESEFTRGLAERFGTSYFAEPIVGLSRARNRGAAYSTKDIVAYLDDDAVPEPDWLKNLIQEFADPTVMSVLGRVISFSPRNEPERILQAFNAGLPDYAEVMHFSKKTPHWFELSNFGGIGIGANMAFRKSIFDIWSGFDERLGYGGAIRGYEDYYAIFSLIELGWKVAFTPTAIVKHPYNPESPTLDFVREKYLNGITSTSAYVFFLFAKQPRYRSETLRYVWNWLLGLRQVKRQKIQPSLASFWQVWRARVSGMRLYFRSRRAEA